MDANNPNVYYDKLEADRTEETMTKTCEELKKAFGKLHAAVLDGNQASIKAYKKVFAGILVQYCLFHFAKNVRDAYKEEVGSGKGRAILPLEHLIGFFSILNVFFDHEREITRGRARPTGSGGAGPSSSGPSAGWSPAATFCKGRGRARSPRTRPSAFAQ